MNKTLVVVDMQNDFIDGSLGTPEAQEIVPKVAEKIRNWDGTIWYTMDTHGENYLNTQEGQILPIKHCIKGTFGWLLQDEVYKALRDKNAYIYQKYSFGDYWLPVVAQMPKTDCVEFVGVCTDICVVSNALIYKAAFPETKLIVDPACCAGTSPELHEAALKVMQSCQIDILNWGN